LFEQELSLKSFCEPITSKELGPWRPYRFEQSCEGRTLEDIADGSESIRMASLLRAGESAGRDFVSLFRSDRLPVAGYVPGANLRRSLQWIFFGGYAVAKKKAAKKKVAKKVAKKAAKKTVKKAAKK
jgi:hypothetical protein